MSMTHVVGVDPGLVHTGVVDLQFWSLARKLEVRNTAIVGPDAAAVASWVSQQRAHPLIYVEQYRQRQHLSSDQRMIQLEHELRTTLKGAKFLPNMGVKRVITRDLMDLLEVWTFPIATHHHDLRAAARVALLGMVKGSDTNVVLADLVLAHLDGQPWTIVHE